MDLEIIIKTCDSNTLSSLPRIYDGKKIDIINKCLTSVVLSAEQCNKQTKITIVDDGSSQECLDMIEKIMLKVLKQKEIIKMPSNDFRATTLKTFELARDSEATLVYCVEDDYLHEPDAIQEMVNFYDFSFNQLHKQTDIVLYPSDDPANYHTRYMDSSFVVLGEKRHWRTNSHATCTFMTTPGLVRRNWETFEHLAKNFGPELMEANTIDKIWSLPTSQLFTPLPSIAIHIHDEARADKLVNWKALWDFVPDIVK